MANNKGTRRGNNEGSITKRKDGTFMGRVKTGYNYKGKPIYKSVYGKTQKEVLSKLEEVKNEMHLGVYVQPDETTLIDWLMYWLNYYKKIKLKPRTYDAYETIINTSIKDYIGQIKLQKLNTRDIQRMYNERFSDGLSANSIRKIQAVLKPALKQAQTEGIISKNPADYVVLPEMQKKEIRVFTKDEQERFLMVAKEYRIYEAFVINLDTGLRLSEILALEWDDINFEKGELSVNKNLVLTKNRKTEKNQLLVQNSSKTKNSTRIIPLTKRSLNLLAQLKLKNQSKSKIVFCSQNFKHVQPRNYERTFSKIVEKANIDSCNTHTMRHTFATRLFESNISAKTISQLLGHSSVSFTLDTYTHVLPNIKKQAIEMLEEAFR